MSEKLKFIREKEGLTQAEFADMVGVSRNSLTNWESEGRTMGVDKLQKITSHNRFRKYAILLATDDNQEDYDLSLKNPTREEITKMLEVLTEEKADQVLEYIKFVNSQNPTNH